MSQRLDQWLVFARLVKTRRLADKVIAEGVLLNGAPVAKNATSIKPGDRLLLTVAGYRRTLTVLATATRRGSAQEAALLYEETAERVRVDVWADP